MAKPKTQKQEIEPIVIDEDVKNTSNTGLVTFRFNRNVNVGGILVQSGSCLDINLSDAKAFKILNVGEIVKEGE